MRSATIPQKFRTISPALGMQNASGQYLDAFAGLKTRKDDEMLWTQITEAENQIRKLFATERAHRSLKDPHFCLIDIYATFHENEQLFHTPNVRWK